MYYGVLFDAPNITPYNTNQKYKSLISKRNENKT